MNYSDAQQVATTIDAGQLLGNINVYLLIGAIVLLSKALDAFISKYFGKRAETLATSADIERVVHQLKATTEATEAVRIQLSKADWLEKEWHVLRRVKLEELLTAACEILELLPYFDLESSTQVDHSNATKMSMLRTLYFPELRSEVSDLYVKHKNAYTHYLAAKQRSLEYSAAGDFGKKLANLAEYANSQTAYMQACVDSHAALEAAAAKLMEKVAAGK